MRYVVAEIVTLIDNDEIIIFPVERRKIDRPGHSLVAAKVSVIQHIVVEAISDEDIALVVLGINRPVFPKLLWCKHQHPIIPQFIVFDNRQSREGLAQTNAVGNNAAAVLFDFVNSAHDPIPLELVELVPNKGLLDACPGLDDGLFREFPQIRFEDVIEGNKVDGLRRIFLVEDFHFRENLFRHIFHGGRVFPDSVKKLQEALCCATSVHAGIGVIAQRRRQPQPVTGKVHRTLNGNILLGVFILHIGEAHLRRVRFPVRFDAHLLPKPFGALLSNGGLGQLVAELQLEIVAG